MKAFLSTLCALVCTGIASANVTVSGTGKVTYVPNVGYVSAGVSTEAKTAAEAWEKNRLAVNKMFEALKQLGIDEKDLKTAGLNLSPKYVRKQYEEPVLVGYVATYDLSVTVRKLNDIGKVLDGLVQSGANRRMGIRFGHTDLDKLLDEARAKAAAEARKKADIYVTAAGAKLGRVLNIADTQPWQPRTYHLDMAPAMMQKELESLKIAAGEQEMNVNVTVTFAIS
jgi:uncharacterized protein YggE